MAFRKDQNSSKFLESLKTHSVIVFQPVCERKLFGIASKSVLPVIRPNWKLPVRKQWNWMVSCNFQVSWTPPNQENWSWWLKNFFGHFNWSLATPVSRIFYGKLSDLRLSAHNPSVWIGQGSFTFNQKPAYGFPQILCSPMPTYESVSKKKVV